MYRVASVTVVHYWRAQYKLTNGLDCHNCSKTQRKECRKDWLYSECPKAIKLEYLSKPVVDSEGNITELGELIADDNAVDLGLGSHTFQFAASDGIEDATGDTDIHDGPRVSSRPSGAGGVGGIRDTRPPVISSIECSDYIKTSIIIKWKTNERSTSQVEYWASKHQFSPLDETLVIYHEVELTNLSPCTVYHFRTISKDRSGNEAISEENTFTTLGTPAAFTVSALSISPAEVGIGESITISVLVTNTGDGSGTYKVTLELDNVAVAAKEVTLAGGTNQKITFTTSRDVAGTYRVDIADLSGTVVVMAVAVPPTPTPVPAPTPAPTPTPTPPPGPNWWLIGGVIAACVVAGLLVYFLVWRRRGATRSA